MPPIKKSDQSCYLTMDSRQNKHYGLQKGAQDVKCKDSCPAQPFTQCVNLAWCLSHFGTSFFIVKVRTRILPTLDKAIMRCK